VQKLQALKRLKSQRECEYIGWRDAGRAAAR
jgi:hypothetical protein